MNSKDEATLERACLGLFISENTHLYLIQFHRFTTKSAIKQFKEYIPDNATVKEWVQVIGASPVLYRGTPYLVLLEYPED